MLLSELEMSGPRENSVGARTWASQVGSLDNVAHVIFRHRNSNKHLRFHIIRADGLGCGRGQRGVLKKSLRDRGAYSKKNLRGRGAYSNKNWILKENLSTQKPTRNTTIGYSKKNWVPHRFPPRRTRGTQKKFEYPLEHPGSICLGYLPTFPPASHMRLSVFFGPISPIHVCTHALGCVFLKRQDESTHYPMRKKTNASQILHTTVES